MSWDWQKRLQSEDPAPLPDDSSFGRLAVKASEQEPADAGETPQAEASARGAGDIDWHPAGAADKNGRSLPTNGLLQLLYGEEHKCAFCRGTGQMRGANHCPVCGGSGKVKLSPPVVVCRFCHGGGHVPPRSTVTCGACRGRGVIKVSPPIQICPNCSGRGKQMGAALYCGRCQGSGVVSVSAPEGAIEHDARNGVEEMVLTRDAVSRCRARPTGTTGARSKGSEESRKRRQGLQWQAAPKGTR